LKASWEGKGGLDRARTGESPKGDFFFSKLGAIVTKKTKRRMIIPKPGGCSGRDAALGESTNWKDVFAGADKLFPLRKRSSEIEADPAKPDRQTEALSAYPYSIATCSERMDDERGGGPR